MPRVPFDRHDATTRVWCDMRAFVEANDYKPGLREHLGLGGRGGFVKFMFLLRGGPRSLAELAAEQNVSAPYVTTVIDQLEQLGLVARTLDDTDKRRKLVTLTAAGADAVALAEDLRVTPPPAIDALSDAELQQLETLLSRLAGATGQSSDG